MSAIQEMVSIELNEVEQKQEERTKAETEEEPPYSIFSPAKRLVISSQASFSAVFSGLSSFIYYPALRPLASDLNTSITAINLSVSAYLIVAGIFPSIIGDIGDQTGRRPVSLLAFTLYFCANLGLALQSSYPALIALRCLQSMGASGTIAIGYGVIADITTPADRGSHVGVLLGFTSSASCLGPIIGGIAAQELSWRWIFWILAILSGANLVGLFLFFPETSRRLVGNGSIDPPSWLNISMYDLLVAHGKGSDFPRSTAPLFTHVPNPLKCLTTLFQKATFLIITIGSIQYTVCTILYTSLATEMADIYSLNYLNAGLVYLPSGVGGFLAAILIGRLIDHDYRVVQRSLGTPSSAVSSRSANNLTDFPIEKARLRSIFPLVVVASLATAGYGWALQVKTHIAVPLALQFISGSTQVAIFVICSTLLTDYNHWRSATAQASYGLARCPMAAAGVAALEPLIQAAGVGWACTMWAGICLLSIPLLLVLRMFGWGWRKQNQGQHPRGGMT